MRSLVGIEMSNTEYELCGNECESVTHVLWECTSSRADALLKFQEKLESAEHAHGIIQSSYIALPFRDGIHTSKTKTLQLEISFE